MSKEILLIEAKNDPVTQLYVHVQEIPSIRRTFNESDVLGSYEQIKQQLVARYLFPEDAA